MKSEYIIMQPDGTFVRFIGFHDGPIMHTIDEEAVIDVTVIIHEVLERGSIYDRQGAD